MKTRFPSILGVFAAILMVASFVVPMNIAAPSAVTADPGMMKWDTITTPGSVNGQNTILNWHGPDANFPALPYDDTGYGSEIIDRAAGNDGSTVVWIVRQMIDPTLGGVAMQNAPPAQALAWGAAIGRYRNLLYYSNNNGISAMGTRVLTLIQNPLCPGGVNAFQVAIAQDDPRTWIVTTDGGSIAPAYGVPPIAGLAGPKMIWITMDAGATWDLAFDGRNIAAVGLLDLNETIRCIDISIDYGGKRDIAFGTVDGAIGGRWVVRSSSGFNNWTVQMNGDTNRGDLLGAATTRGISYQDIKFSPTYGSDSAIALVFSVDGLAGALPGPIPPASPASPLFVGFATYFNVALRDLQQNQTLQMAYGSNAVEVRDENLAAGVSPSTATLNGACLQLPSDFSGQSSSLRRAYVSLDAYTFKNAVDVGGLVVQEGIYRIDDTTRYVLMNTTTTVNKTIYSIAYFGTYASGKLLGGERMGSPCTASVPTWFTDSPTTCPIPCWYPALKPTTGAANQGTCGLNALNGNGSAIVNWNADGSLGLVATGSLPATIFAGLLGNGGVGGITTPPNVAPPWGVFVPIASTVGGPLGWWYQQMYWNAKTNDESAFAISRNNGETWNQIALIDTTIDWFNDVAIAPDCTTIYLASVNRNTAFANWCNEFDSVWRATVNPNVAAPLPAVPPIGTYWERVYTHTTSTDCGIAQDDLPILRVVSSCTDKPDGEIVGWASQTSRTAAGNGVMAWSPDYGDYWATITPRNAVQDFAFESSTTIYVVNRLGMVQRLPYSGTSWSTNLASTFSLMDLAHTIVAVPDGKVLVGAGAGAQFPSSYSADKGLNWGQSPALAGHGNEHIIFDVDFKNNSFIYMGDDTLVVNGLGSVYRNTAPSYTRWADNDMMTAVNGGAWVFAATIGLAWPVWVGAPGNPPHIRGQFGLVQAWTGAEPQGATAYGPALYSAHSPIYTSQQTVLPIPTASIWDSAVCRTLVARSGMPKPGVSWDCLDIFAPLTTAGVRFTLEPSSLKACGCCTLDTNTTLYAIDDERNGMLGRWWRPDVPVVGIWTYGINPLGGYAPFLGQQAAPGVMGVAGVWGSGPQGMLWAYTDCLAKKGPILKAPADKFLVGADPVTGRNQQVDLSWEQLCLSTWYELQLGKDAAFTLRINPGQGGAWTGNSAGNIVATQGSILLAMDATNMTSPAAWLAPGSLPEAGAIYYWRIRSARSATQQLAASPWSEVRSFTVKAGFIVNTPYYGVQLLAPNNGCLGCKIKPASFSWSPWKEATKYQFDLATDPEFKSLVVTSTTTTTGYEYSGTLNYSTNYFWRVKALEVNGQNIPSDWSATFSMQTEPAPAPPAPPPAEPATPIWVWVIIAIGAILVIVTLVLIFKTRRV